MFIMRERALNSLLLQSSASSQNGKGGPVVVFHSVRTATLVDPLVVATKSLNRMKMRLIAGSKATGPLP
jgi:hypothetical protein